MAGVLDDPNCAVCYKITQDNDLAICCDGFCLRWFHLECLKLSKDEYSKIEVLGDKVKWFCALCEVRFKKVQSKITDVDAFLDLNSTVTKLFEIVKGVVKDNIQLNNKFDSHISEAGCQGSDRARLHSQPKPITPGVDSVVSSEQDNIFVLNEVQEHSKVCESTDGSDVNSVRKSYSRTLKNPGDADWTKVGKNGRPKSSKLSPKTKSVVIGSNSEKSGIKTAERLKHVFVSRCKSDTVPGDIESYLKQEGVSSVKCDKLNTRYSDYTSFKISIPESHFKSVLKSDFWPKGIFVKEFFQPRHPRSSDQSGPKPIVSRTFLAREPART